MAKNWYILHIYTGYEKKVSGEIARLLENEELNSSIVTSVKIPEKKIEEEKNGKKHTRTDKFLPGYLMIEMDLPELDWKSTCNVIRHIKGVTGFVGTNANTRPRPISQEEARNLFQEMGEIKSDKGTRARLSFSAGDQVKITEGPFASFEGVIDEANAEKDKLRVIVQIFGRSTPVDVNYSQVVKKN
ncbi:MAG: transcription termination/antitermination factor NusG [Treponema sp.]|nr:transcription termination/antitermination factor NusG [Treponema sp.]